MKCRVDLFENRKIISKLYFQPSLDIKTMTCVNDTECIIFVAVESSQSQSEVELSEESISPSLSSSMSSTSSDLNSSNRCPGVGIRASIDGRAKRRPVNLELYCEARDG